VFVVLVSIAKWSIGHFLLKVGPWVKEG